MGFTTAFGTKKRGTRGPAGEAARPVFSYSCRMDDYRAPDRVYYLVLGLLAVAVWALLWWLGRPLA